MGTLLELQQARQGRKERKKSRKINEKKDRLILARQSIEQVRQAQIARAQVVQQAQSTGAGDSSAVAGALGSIQSQVGSNIGFAQQLFNLQKESNRRLERAAEFDVTSQNIGKINEAVASGAG